MVLLSYSYEAMLSKIHLSECVTRFRGDFIDNDIDIDFGKNLKSCETKFEFEICRTK